MRRRDFGDVKTARAWHQALHEAGIEAVLTAGPISVGAPRTAPRVAEEGDAGAPASVRS